MKVKNDDKGYGSNYQQHLLEQYKIYVEEAGRLNTRRDAGNAFFLGIDTAILAATIAGISRCPTRTSELLFLIALVGGFALNEVWDHALVNYRILTAEKYRIIREIEGSLPIRPFLIEDVKLKAHKPKYRSFTQIEVYVPRIFKMIYLGFFFMMAATKFVRL